MKQGVQADRNQLYIQIQPSGTMQPDVTLHLNVDMPSPCWSCGLYPAHPRVSFTGESRHFDGIGRQKKIKPAIRNTPADESRLAMPDISWFTYYICAAISPA